jgi:RNA polymerase sigma-70 factor (ECF subfamily)
MTAARYEIELGRIRSGMVAYAMVLARGNLDLAEDLVAAAAAHGLKYIGQWNDETPFRNYMYRILKHRWLQHCRREYRHDPPASLEAGIEVAVPSCEDEILAELNERRLRSIILDQLTTRDATLLLLDAEGLTTAELAAAQGVPEGTARSRLFRARVKAREALGFG